MTVELTRRDEFAVITLNRPEALNALSFDIVGQIGNAIAAAADTDARALIITVPAIGRSVPVRISRNFTTALWQSKRHPPIAASACLHNWTIFQ